MSKAITTFVSSEVIVILVVPADFTHVGQYTFAARTNAGDADSPELLEDAILSFPAQPDTARLLLKAQMIARLDAQGFANLYRNGDLPLTGDFGAKEWR